LSVATLSVATLSGNIERGNIERGNIERASDQYLHAIAPTAHRLYKSLPRGEAVKTIVGHCVGCGLSMALSDRGTDDRKEIVMKTRITAVALAAVLATPALAQTVSNQPRPYDPSAYARGNPGDYQSRARVRLSPNSRNDVYDFNGRYLGSDPDPLVRDQLRRDPTQGVE
jgi:hypothetical protein